MPINTVSLGYLCPMRRKQIITCCIPRAAMGICASITLSLWNKYTADITVFCAVGGNYCEALKLLSAELVMGVFVHCRGSLTLPVCSPTLSGGSCGTGAQGSICSFPYLQCLLPACRALSFVTVQWWQPIDECARGSATQRHKPLLNWNTYFISCVKYLRLVKQ